MLFPACVARIVHVPAATNVAVVPLTVQTPVAVELKETGNPEVAVAVSVSGVPTLCVPGLLNVIVCAVGPAAVTVRVAELLVTLPTELLTVTLNVELLSDVAAVGVVELADVALLMAPLFFVH